MNRIEQASEALLQLLKEKKKVTNSRMLEALKGDEQLFREIRESLILDELAEDMKGVGLVYIGPDEPKSPAPQPEPQTVSQTECGKSPSRRLRIFISYGRDEHADVALKLRDDLMSRGHEVWFDQDQLRTGDAWEGHIEEGLEWVAAGLENGRLLFLMTPHSVRRDGYCRKELAFALQRNIRVMPVKLAEVQPPLPICSFQWLDMRDVIPLNRRLDRYYARFARLIEELVNDKLRLDGVQARLESLLNPLSFEADIQPHLERFTGREWLIDEIDKWISEPNPSRVFWIVGDPGSGKTALATWLWANRSEVAAFHLCRHGHYQKSDPRQVVRSIAYQLSSLLPDYQERLNGLPDLESLSREASAAEMFHSLIVEPLHGGFPRPDHPIVILIDGLDEATRGHTNELAEFLASEWAKTPDWLRLIVTSQDVSEVTHPLQAWKPRMIKGQENLPDLRCYFERELKPFAKGGDLPSRTVETLLERSEGLFLYADRVRSEVEAGRLSLDKLNDFPRGLGGVYAEYSRRQFPDRQKYKNDDRDLLALVVAAREPLSLVYLAGIFGLDEHRREDIPDHLGSLFPCVAGVLKPYHRTVIDWLTEKGLAGPYFVSKELGNRRLADKGWEEFHNGVETMSDYSRAHLPDHLLSTDRWEDVVRLLTDLEYFPRAWSDNENAVRAWWVEVKEKSPHCMEKAYVEMIQDPNVANESLVSLSNLLYSGGELDQAAAILQSCAGRCRDQDDHSLLQECLLKLGHIQADRGRRSEAMESYQEVERICRELDDWKGFQSALGSQGVLFEQSGNWDRALELYRTQEQICRDHSILRGLQASLNNQGLILAKRGDPDRAMDFWREQEKICQNRGLRVDLATCLGNQANMFADWGDVAKAMELYERQEKICRELDLKDGLQRCLGNRGMLLFQLGQCQAAIGLVDEKEKICTTLDLQKSLTYALGQKGTILLELGRWDEAMACFEEQARKCREIDFPGGLQWALWNQGEAWRKKGDTERALSLFHAQESICRKLDLRDGLDSCLGSKAEVIKDHDLESALILLKEQAQICRQLGKRGQLAASLVTQAEILVNDPSRRDEAISMMEEAQVLGETHGHKLVLESIKKVRNQFA